MVRQEIRLPILVVEGDDDYFVLEKHKSDDLYLITGGGGRPMVLAAAALAQRHSLPAVKFLADADFDRFVNPAHAHPENVVLSHHHDFFMDLIFAQPHIIDWVIQTHYRSALRRNGNTAQPPELRKMAVLLAARLAALRIVNERKGLGLNLKEFPFGKFRSLEPTVDAIARIAIERSDTALSVDELVLEIEEESAHKSAEINFLVGDHDFFRALARVLDQYKIKVSDTTLCSSFISALNCGLIMTAKWYETITHWCSTYGYTAFRCPCLN